MGSIEGGKDAARAERLRFGGCEGGVDWLDLAGVDGPFAIKAEARRLSGVADQRIVSRIEREVGAVDRLEVRWANGPTVAYEIPAVDTELVIDQSRGVVRSEPGPAPGTLRR